MTLWDYADKHPFLAIVWAVVVGVMGGYMILGLIFVVTHANVRRGGRTVTIAVDGEADAPEAEGRPS